MTACSHVASFSLRLSQHYDSTKSVNSQYKQPAHTWVAGTVLYRAPPNTPYTSTPSPDNCVEVSQEERRITEDIVGHVTAQLSFNSSKQS